MKGTKAGREGGREDEMEVKQEEESTYSSLAESDQDREGREKCW